MERVDKGAKARFHPFVVILCAALAVGCASFPFPIPGPTPRPVARVTPEQPSPSAIPPSPTATAQPTVTPTSGPTPTPTATVKPKPAPVENFRGGLKDTEKPFRRGGRVCRNGGATIWFWMTEGRKSCDPGSLFVQPADYDHMGVPHGTPYGQAAINMATCKPVAENFQGRPWDTPLGPTVTVTTGVNPQVTHEENPYEFTVCAAPGPVVFTVCPPAFFFSCVDPECANPWNLPYAERASCKCEHVALKPAQGTGCSEHKYRFPVLP